MSEVFPGGGETGALIRSLDWSKTPLGPIESWPMSLKTVVRVMLNARQPMILWWGPELIQLYNDAMLVSMGDKHPSGMGQPGPVAWKETWEAVGHELQSVLEEGAAIWNTDVFVPVQRDSKLDDAWWTYSYSPVFDDAGNRNGILIICTETTAGVVARRQADVARDELRAAFLQAPSPIAILVGDDHTFALANTAYERLVNRPVLGRKLAEAFSPEEVDAYRVIIERVYRTSEPFDLKAAELRLPNADGVIEQRYIDVGYYPYRDAGQKTIGVIAFINDVTAAVTARLEAERGQTERTALFEQERLLRAAAEEANRLKDSFLATVSHELRTPLTAMLGWVQMLRTGKLPEHRRTHALETIERNARAQGQLIEDLLDISRITSGKMKLEVETLTLAPIIEAAVDALRPAAEARGITLSVILDSAVAVRGDAMRLHQIVANLIGNAVKFTPRGGKIRVTVEQSHSTAELAVADTGQGIAASFVPLVFDQFRQADETTTRSHGGLGLGLAIVKRLVELHGGTVSVESPGVGLGATFRVRLPIAAVKASAPEPPRTSVRAPAAPLQEFTSPPELRGVKVLVVEDEKDTRDLLRALLEECGAVVETAASVRDALEAVTKFRPDILLSDIGMPHEDGYALIRRIRELTVSEGGRTPAVALSAFTRGADRTRALRAGFKAHVSKPVEPAELVAVLAALAPER